MRPPSDQLRDLVASRTEDSALSGLVSESQEQQLEQLLDQIDNELISASDTEIDRLQDLTEEQAESQLATIDAWASLMSYAVARVYAPASPWPRRKAGWGQNITRSLRRMVKRLQSLLAPVAKVLKATHFSIAVGYPWGVQIGMSF